MSELKKITTAVPPSKINITRDSIEPITIDQIETLNYKFWNEQSVNLHKCYKQGHAYANNSNKKTAINLLQDMFKLLKQQYKNCSENERSYEHIFEQINISLQLVEDLGNTVDKNCILSIIQGYTLGCLKRYEKQQD